MRRCGVGYQPPAHNTYDVFGAIGMRLDVLTADVGKEPLVPVPSPVHDQSLLFSLKGRAKSLRAQEEAQLEGHVEPR